MQSLVKKWFSAKGYGFLDNGEGPDILVLKSDLIGSQYLKTGVHVEFECHVDQKNLRAKKVKMLRRKIAHHRKNTGNYKSKKSPFGVMT